MLFAEPLTTVIIVDTLCQKLGVSEIGVALMSIQPSSKFRRALRNGVTLYFGSIQSSKTRKFAHFVTMINMVLLRFTIDKNNF